MKTQMERFKEKNKNQKKNKIKTKAYCGEEIDMLNQKQKPTCLQ